MALTRLPSFTLLNTDSFTFGNANISGNITAGNLKTDHLLYANGSPYVFTTSAAGSNTQLQFNDGGSFAGSANLTFNKTTNTLSVTALAVSGNVTAGNLTTSGTSGNISGANNITANFFIGNGASLSAIAGSNVTGAVSYATTANSVAAANVSGLGNLALLNKDGNSSNILYGNGVFAGAPVTYNNSSVATYLASFGSNTISTTGNVSVGNITVGGNLTVNGTLTSINSTIVEIDDLAIVLANDASSASQANGAGIIINGASANMLYVSTSNSFVFSHSISTSGNITAGNVITSGSGGNISGANTITANYFVGNGASLSAIAGANVTGFVPNANVANTAYSVAVANVSGIGNIATINKDGNASNILYGNGVFASAPVTYGNSNVATYLASFGSNTITTTGNVSVGNIIGNGQALTGINGSNVTGQVGNALVAGTVYTAAQPNITSVGTLTGLTSGGTVNLTTASNVSLGAVGNVHITGGASGQMLQTDGNGNVAWVTPSGTTITVDNFTGNGVQTAYTLTVTPVSKAYTMVSLAGTLQPRTVYSLAGNVVTFSSAPPSTAPIEITTFSITAGTGNSDITANTLTANTVTASTLSGNIISSNANLTVNTLTANTLSSNNIVNTGTGTPTLNSSTSINLTAATVVRATTSPFQFYNCTTTVRDAIAASNGYVIYNTTTNKLQVYANGTWVDLH